MEGSFTRKMFEALKFNLWVFWHDIRFHSMGWITKSLEYPYREHIVCCFTCLKQKKITYEDGLENYY